MNYLKLKTMLLTFFEEDLGNGDLTSESIFLADDISSGVFTAKEDGIFCGQQVIEVGFKLFDEKTSIFFHVNDGTEVKQGEKLATVTGPVHHLLAAERVVLNLIQRMSGIATQTNKAVASVSKGSMTKICDTRKTTPGLRMLEKYAVKCGGGYNHRLGLYDAVMIKDNHIVAAGGIKEAVQKVKEKLGHTVKFEVETECRDDVKAAVSAKADIIMFDNRSPEEIIEFKKLVPNEIITEASGGITMDNIYAYSKTNVDYISLGFLTHSVKAFDISFNIEVNLEI